MTGSGTANDPYKIYNVTDLQNIENDLTAYYELGGNIDAAATSGWDGGEGFTPISDFTGQLDGKGHTITGFFINRTGSTNQALFGEISGSAVVKNISMTGVDITSNHHYTASLVGEVVGSSASIINCSSTGSVEQTRALYLNCGGLIGRLRGGVVKNCYSTCSVTAVGDYVGGLIGWMDDGDVDECYATGAVIGGDDQVGGFVGRANGGTIDDCYATGAVALTDDYGGGFIGYNGGTTIDSCYSTGVVTGGGACIGGFCGYNNGITTNCYARGTVSGDDRIGGFAGINTEVLDDCYSTGAVTGNTNIGGFCGDNTDTITNCFWDTETSGTETSDGGTGKTTAQMKTQSTFTDAGWDFTTPIWYINRTINDGYPAFIGIVRRIKGNPNIDQRMFQHVERIDR